MGSNGLRINVHGPGGVQKCTWKKKGRPALFFSPSAWAGDKNCSQNFPKIEAKTQTEGHNLTHSHRACACARMCLLVSVHSFANHVKVESAHPSMQ